MEGHTFRSIENAEEIKRRKLFGTRFMESRYVSTLTNVQFVCYWLFLLFVVVDDQLLTFSWNLCFELLILERDNIGQYKSMAL